jgi:hypothetical protein
VSGSRTLHHGVLIIMWGEVSLFDTPPTISSEAREQPGSKGKSLFPVLDQALHYEGVLEDVGMDSHILNLGIIDIGNRT